MAIFFNHLLIFLSTFTVKKQLAIAFRILIVSLLVTLLASAFVGMFNILSTRLDALSYSMPYTCRMVWSWVMPKNASQCIKVIFYAYIIRYFFVMTSRMLYFKAKAILNAA